MIDSGNLHFIFLFIITKSEKAHTGGTEITVKKKLELITETAFHSKCLHCIILFI